jgi:malonyl-CoA O-methyltransferase
MSKVSEHTVAHFFSRAASRYDAHAQLQRDILQHALAYAVKHFPEDAHVLDAGCGTGAFARVAAEMAVHWQLDGLDIAPGMCALSAPLYNAMHQASVEAIPVASERYDAVFSGLAMQWVNSPKTAFQEIYRVLKPGGYAVVSCFTEGTLQELQHSAAAVGMGARTLMMRSVADYAQAIAAGDLLLQKKEVIQQTHHVAMLAQLFHGLRGIGAMNAVRNREKRFTTRGEIQRLASAYEENFSDNQGLRVTWNAVIFVMKRPVV